MNTNDKNDRDIQKIIIWGSSLAAGAGVASLEALRPHSTFEVSGTTAVAFAVGAAGLWGYWKLFFSPQQGPAWRRLRVLATGLIAAAGVMGFLYPMRYVASAKYTELATGLSAAVCALSVVATLLLCCRRMFEGDDKKEG